MIEFDVEIDCSSLERSRAGLITGELSLKFGETWFPERQWNDFPVVVLEWWLVALRDLRKGAAELRFMDGPFLVKTSLQRQQICKLEGIEDGQARQIDVESEVSVRRVYESIIRAAQLICTACVERGWSNDDDVQRLQSTLRKAVGELPETNV